MIIYIFIIILIVVLGLAFYSGTYSKANKIKAKTTYIFIICSVMLLISGLRNVAVGEDTYAYFLTFNEVKNTSWSQTLNEISDYYSSGLGKDPGYTLFQKILQIISTDYTVYLLIVSSIFHLSLAKFINDNTAKLSDATIALLIYFVLFFSVFSITALRQSIALAITMHCYKYVKEKRLLPFLFFILMGSMIHRSILVFIPFYFLCQIKYTKYLFSLVLLLFPLFLWQKATLSAYLISLGGYEEYEAFDGAGTYVFTGIFIFISLIALVRRKYILKKDMQFKNYYNAFSIALVLLPLSWVHPALLRITMYFSIFMLLFIPEILRTFDTTSVKFRRGLMVGATVLLIGLFLQSAYRKNLEYKFYWEEMKLGKNYE